ncbi:hypothetical protein BJX65DRAFT_311174 [Aspergillus insuetus]
MKSVTAFAAALLFGSALALPTELASESNSNQAAHKATVESDNAYTEFGWVGKREERGAEESTVEAANGYTEFVWVGKRDIEEATVEADNAYTEFGWVGKRDN